MSSQLLGSLRSDLSDLNIFARSIAELSSSQELIKVIASVVVVFIALILEKLLYATAGVPQASASITDNGTLIRVIDVYIKTLPKADRTLLEKGFVVLGETELYAIIEDYTG